MGAFQEYIKSALASIRSNKGRSFLTMLGIIIGITSVLVILMVGDGVEAQMKTELNKNIAEISVSLITTKTDKYITRDAYNKIEEAFGDDILGLNAAMETTGTIVSYRHKDLDAMISGNGAAYKIKNDLKMIYGRYYSVDDVHESNYVCVMPASSARDLFGYENVVGESLNITHEDKTSNFTIIGVRQDNEADRVTKIFADVSIEMPYTALCGLCGYNPDEKLTGLGVVVDAEHRAAVVARTNSVIENVLEIRGEKAVKVKNGNSSDITGNILGMIKSVIILIAAISLVVGGIGVMNIMTVSVTERTREIGIRKSIGARTSSIMIQFLAEAAILTVTGGFLGLAFGIGIAFIASKVANIPFVIKPLSVIFVVGISIFIGLFFGIAPARKAARLNPIDALHTD